MLDQNLLDYVKNQRKNGVDDETIKKNLLANHWSEKHIHEALYGVVPDPKRDRLLSISQLFSAAWTLFTGKLLQLLFISSLPTLIASGVGLIIGVVYVPLAGIFATLFSSLNIAIVILIALIIIIALLAFFYITLWSQTALIMCVSQDDISIKESFTRSRPYIWRLYWVALLTGLIVMGYFSLAFIPGFIAAIWFSQVNFIVVTEDEKGMSALLKSREYIRGRWFPVFGRVFVFGLGFVIILSIIQAVLHLLGSTALETIISFLVQLASGSFYICLAYVLYDDLKKVRGKFDFRPTRKTKIIYALPGLLVVPLFITFLASFILLALNPMSQIRKTQTVMRINNMRSIRNAAEYYYASNGKLPTSLETLIPIELPYVPKDAVQGVTYQIIILGPMEFKVCAVTTEGNTVQCDDNVPAIPVITPSGPYNSGNGQR